MQSIHASLSVSIVVYRSEKAVLIETLTALAEAVTRLDRLGPLQGSCELVLIDNDTKHQVKDLVGQPAMGSILTPFERVQVIEGQGNVGYGRAHNLAIAALESRTHLVLNPDAVLSPDALVTALDFLNHHEEVVLLAPRVVDADGQLQFLCRRYPTVLDLFVRGVVPRDWRRPFAEHLARYEMRDVIGADRTVVDPPIVSGCFMLFRTRVLKELGGFDPRFFLYFEDYDLSIRAARLGRIAYVPSVLIQHGPGGAARKGPQHIRLFLASALRFFLLHGWKWF